MNCGDLFKECLLFLTKDKVCFLHINKQSYILIIYTAVAGFKQHSNIYKYVENKDSKGLNFSTKMCLGLLGISSCTLNLYSFQKWESSRILKNFSFKTINMHRHTCMYVFMCLSVGLSRSIIPFQMAQILVIVFQFGCYTPFSVLKFTWKNPFLMGTPLGLFLTPFL